MTTAPDFSVLRRRYERRAAFAALGFAALVLAAAFLVRLSGAVSAEGQLIVAGENYVVHHPDGGRVAEVLVENGASVAAGTPILRLDGGELQTERARLQRQLEEQTIRLSRLRAAAAGQSTFAGSTLRGREAEPVTDADISAIVRTQSEALKAEREALASEISRAASRAKGAEAARTALQDQIRTNAARQALIDKEIADLTVLVDDQLVSRTRLTALQREALDVRQRLEALQLEDKRLETEAAGARLDMTNLTRRDADRLWREIEDAEHKQADYARQIEAISARIGRLVLEAPATGRVHELAQRNPGGFIAPGAFVLKIVPEQSTTRIRARISLTDADDVKVGQAARVQFDTFQAAGAPEFKARVLTVSPDRSTDVNTGAAFYELVLSVDAKDEARFAALGAGAGVPVTVRIETRQRSLAAYLLEPAADAFGDMFSGP